MSWGATREGVGTRFATAASIHRQVPENGAAHKADAPSVGGHSVVATETVESLRSGQFAIAFSLAVAIQLFLATGMSGPATVTGYVALVVAAASPVTGLASLALMTPLRQPVGYGPMDFHTVLAVAALLGCVIALAAERRTVRLDFVWLTFLAFGAFAAIQVLATPQDFLGDQTLYAQLQLFGLVGGGALMLAAQYLLRNRSWDPFLDCLLIGGVAASALVIASTLTQGSTETTLSGLYGIPDLLRERPAGPFNLPNYFGLFAALALIVGVYRIGATIGLRRYLIFTATALIACALLLSYSRGALIAGAVGLIVLLYFKNKAFAILLTLLFVATATIGYTAFYDARLSVTNPLSTLDQAQSALETSDEGRFAGGAVSIELWQRDPIFGIGFGQYHFVSPLYVGGTDATYSHDWYLDVFAEQGVVGVALLSLAALAVVSKLRSVPIDRRHLAIGVLAAYVVGNFFTESPPQMQTSSVAWLVVGGAFAIAVARQVEPPPTVRFVAGVRPMDANRAGVEV